MTPNTKRQVRPTCVPAGRRWGGGRAANTAHSSQPRPPRAGSCRVPGLLPRAGVNVARPTAVVEGRAVSPEAWPLFRRPLGEETRRASRRGQAAGTLRRSRDSGFDRRGFVLSVRRPGCETQVWVGGFPLWRPFPACGRPASPRVLAASSRCTQGQGAPGCLPLLVSTPVLRGQGPVSLPSLPPE